MATHPLKTVWHLWYVPAVDYKVVQAEYGGDYGAAQAATQRDIATIGTVEEMWSSFNVMPPPASFPVNDTIAFMRQDKMPSFEDFPGGGRIILVAFPELADKLVERVCIGVLGQQSELVFKDGEHKNADGELPNAHLCSGVRIARRKKKNEDNLRVEVWIQDEAFGEPLVDWFKRILEEDKQGGTQITFEPFSKFD